VRRFWLATALAVSIALAGCGGDAGGAESNEEPQEITVSAASSLTEALEVYGEETETEEKFSFAGSDDLAAQIRQGAPVDVFAAANRSLPDALYEEGHVEEPTTFIANELVLAVPTDSPFADDSEAPLGLLGADVDPPPDVVIGAEGVPVGDYTREVLAGLPAAKEEGILSKVRSEEPDVKSIVAKLTTGAADAGFVYASDVEATGDELVALELPAELQPVVEYGVAIAVDSDSPEAAEEFVDGLLDGTGREALLDAGFLKPEGE
jgi:molybdate transport system substrate-binding protein